MPRARRKAWLDEQARPYRGGNPRAGIAQFDRYVKSWLYTTEESPGIGLGNGLRPGGDLDDTRVATGFHGIDKKLIQR